MRAKMIGLLVTLIAVTTAASCKSATAMSPAECASRIWFDTTTWKDSNVVTGETRTRPQQWAHIPYGCEFMRDSVLGIQRSVAPLNRTT